MDMKMNYKTRNKKDNLLLIKNDEEKMNDKKSIFKINLKKIDYYDVLGIEDCFEFKNKFYSVKCISDSAEVKIIKINELLRIIWHSSGEDLLYLLRIIIDRKNILKNEIINGVKNLEKKILFNFDIRYENLINYNQNIYCPKSNACLKDKIKSHYFLNFTKNKKKENEANRVVSAIKAKGYKMGLQDILDENVNFLAKSQTKIEKKIYRNQSAINLNILKNLLRDRPSIPHEFNFKKQNFQIFTNSDNDLEYPLSNRLSPISSKGITNYTSLKNNINSFREFSGFSSRCDNKKYLQIKREKMKNQLSNNNLKKNSFQNDNNKNRNPINNIKKINKTIYNKIKYKFKNKELNIEKNMNFENNTIVKKPNLLGFNNANKIRHKLNTNKDSILFTPKNNVRMKKTMSLTSDNIELVRNKILSAKIITDKTNDLLKKNMFIKFRSNRHKNKMNINLSGDEYSPKNKNEIPILSNDNKHNITKEQLKQYNVNDFLSVKKNIHFFGGKMNQHNKLISPNNSKPSFFYKND
jgi:hypothetical protein